MHTSLSRFVATASMLTLAFGPLATAHAVERQPIASIQHEYGRMYNVAEMPLLFSSQRGGNPARWDASKDWKRTGKQESTQIGYDVHGNLLKIEEHVEMDRNNGYRPTKIKETVSIRQEDGTWRELKTVDTNPVAGTRDITFPPSEPRADGTTVKVVTKQKRRGGEYVTDVRVVTQIDAEGTEFIHRYNAEGELVPDPALEGASVVEPEDDGVPVGGGEGGGPPSAEGSDDDRPVDPRELERLKDLWVRALDQFRRDDSDENWQAYEDAWQAYRRARGDGERDAAPVTESDLTKIDESTDRRTQIYTVYRRFAQRCESELQSLGADMPENGREALANYLQRVADVRRNIDTYYQSEGQPPWNGHEIGALVESLWNAHISKRKKELFALKHQRWPKHYFHDYERDEAENVCRQTVQLFVKALKKRVGEMAEVRQRLCGDLREIRQFHLRAGEQHLADKMKAAANHNFATRAWFGNSYWVQPCMDFYRANPPIFDQEDVRAIGADKWCEYKHPAGFYFSQRVAMTSEPTVEELIQAGPATNDSGGASEDTTSEESTKREELSQPSQPSEPTNSFEAAEQDIEDATGRFREAAERYKEQRSPENLERVQGASAALQEAWENLLDQMQSMSPRGIPVGDATHDGEQPREPVSAPDDHAAEPPENSEPDGTGSVERTDESATESAPDTEPEITNDDVPATDTVEEKTPETLRERFLAKLNEFREAARRCEDDPSRQNVQHVRAAWRALGPASQEPSSIPPDDSYFVLFARYDRFVYGNILDRFGRDQRELIDKALQNREVDLTLPWPLGKPRRPTEQYVPGWGRVSYSPWTRTPRWTPHLPPMDSVVEEIDEAGVLP